MPISFRSCSTHVLSLKAFLAHLWALYASLPIVHTIVLTRPEEDWRFFEEAFPTIFKVSKIMALPCTLLCWRRPTKAWRLKSWRPVDIRSLHKCLSDTSLLQCAHWRLKISGKSQRNPSAWTWFSYLSQRRDLSIPKQESKMKTSRKSWNLQASVEGLQNQLLSTPT